MKKIELLETEEYRYFFKEKKEENLNHDEINKKYEECEIRIVTETGAIKLELIPHLFGSNNYNLSPDFQRKNNSWNQEKKSRLIESFIMNIPIPPIFLYEVDYNKYEIMDGLQRLSTIISFFNDEFELEGLDKWSELNGMKYNQLPSKIKQGIARRQLTTITLLKESTDDKEEEEEMKKMVFERLNTGGVKLEVQEIRNALYNGKFNKACIELSKNKEFKKLMDTKSKERMEDIELILRFFSMRHIEHYRIKLSSFLDNCLKSGNSYSDKTIDELKTIFIVSMKFLNLFLGNKAYSYYRESRGKYGWSKEIQKMIFDPINLYIHENYETIKSIVDSSIQYDIDKNIRELEIFYKENTANFNGKNQSKLDIERRKELFQNFFDKLLEV